MDFIGMGVFLPAASAGLKSAAFTGAAVIVQRIRGEVEGLKGEGFIFVGAGCRGVQGEYGSVGGEDAAPGVFVMILLPTNGDAMVDAGKIPIDEFDKVMRMLLPCGV